MVSNNAGTRYAIWFQDVCHGEIVVFPDASYDLYPSTDTGTLQRYVEDAILPKGNPSIVLESYRPNGFWTIVRL